MMEGRFLLTYAALISLLALQGGRLAEAQGVMPSEVCGLEGFELDTLAQPAYWSLTIDRQLCLIPYGYIQSNITNCVVYMSVCKPLPGAQCGGQTNSSTCQEATTNDGVKHYFSIGDYRGNDGYEPLGDDDHDVGFVTIRQGDTANSLRCNNTFETTITWTCVKDAGWDIKSPDITTHLRTATKGLTDCELIMSLSYDGACYVAPTLGPDTCQLPPYDIPALAAQDYWYATVPPEVCYNSGTETCKIYFAFCQALPVSLGSNCYGAAVCQVGTNTEAGPYTYNMGRFNSTRFEENDDNVAGGFHMDVENGTQPDDGKCNRIRGLKTRVVLACNSTAKWTNQDLTGYVMAIHEATDPCDYYLEIPYSGACIPILPVSGLTPSPVGWILIGLFFFAVIVYLVVGTLFQYVVRGARGLEMIPNYEFWAQFFFMVLEGCKFSLDIITCFQCDGKMKPSIVTSAGRGGVEYDKI